uniref:Protein PAT1 homolog 1-like n=1 Tax=Rhizophora mucronata TaxID=61149 RepID=A0A2P2M3C7_RHIMU
MERSDGKDFKDSIETSSGTVFDASQYEFFGQHSMEEMELVGLEDEVDNPVFRSADDEYRLFEKDDGVGLGSLSEVDDLASTFAKLNRVVTGPRNPGVIGDRGSGSFSRESSSATEWAQDGEFSSWLDQQIIDIENAQEKRWSSQPQPSSALFSESKPLYRASSYPQQQQQPLHFSSEPILVPKSNFTSFPPSGGGVQHASPHHQNMPSLSSGLQLPFSAPNLSHFSNSNLHLAGLHQGFHCGGNVSHVPSSGLSFNNRPQKHWVDHSGLLHLDHTGILQSILHQQSSRQDLIPAQLSPQQLLHHQRLHPKFQPSLAHLAALQSQFYGAHHSPSHKMVPGLADVREQKHKSSQRGRQNTRSSQQGSDTGSQKSDSGWVQVRSKHMTSEEIESILKMQHAATHSNDPYIDDYYHQASLAKRSAGSRLKHQFCPSHLKEVPSRARNSSDQHSLIHVDALGKIPLPSIRRPRPLLEGDLPGLRDGSSEKIIERPLEQEPMLAARITIEDCLSVLIDVEDINRFLRYNQPQDGGTHLRRKRQAMLEEVTASLQLVDPLGQSGKTTGLASKDDLVFLRLVSLPKGRKLISKFLQLLLPGSELTRIVCMAIFRHLRFLFGGVPSESGAAESTMNLAKTVSACIGGMDLRALSACLVAVVCSLEQPPFRPLGSPAGDGASIILKSLLERATKLLNDPQAAANCSLPNFALWQASFDEFFVLLTKYCHIKYDTILQSAYAKVASSTEDIDSEVCAATKCEMPVELLRACLPHTNERQMELLRHFGQQQNPFSVLNAYSGNRGHFNSESVQS